jgi:hypothetical protein
MKNRLFFISVALIFVAACNQAPKKQYTNEKGQKVIEEWFNDNQIKSRTTYLTNDDSTYIYCLWYESGELKDSSKYIKQKADGLRIYYDQDADLKHYEFYKNGIFHGLHKAVYGNGAVSFEGFHKNGKKVGEWHFNYPNNDPITYEFYDSTGKLLYFRKYNENSIVSETKGSAIIDVIIIENSLAQDTILINVICANPPGSVVSIDILDDLDEVLLSQVLKDVKNKFWIPVTHLGLNAFNVKVSVNDAGKVESHKKNLTFEKR